MPPPQNIEEFVNGFDANSLYLQRQSMHNSFGHPYYPGAYPASPVSPVSPNASSLLQPPPHNHLPRYQQPPNHQLYNQQWHQTRQRSPQYNSQRNTAALAATRQLRPPSQPKTQDDFILIGSQMLDTLAPWSWKCGYSSSASASSASSSVYNNNNNTNNLLSASPPYTIATSVGCSWTGPLSMLAAHFESAHHAFENLYPEHRWSQCLTCDHIQPGWEDTSGSWSENGNPNCPSGRCFARGSMLRKS